MSQQSYRQIDMRGKRLFEDFRLASSPPERIREITVVNSAYDSILSADFTYVSTPITSGAILYEAMDAAGAKTVDELKRDPARFGETVIGPNLKAAEDVARAMLSFGGAVIAPAAFEARSLGWGQDEYMGLWLDTIERKATRLAMVDGWEYSNGGAEEYLQALLMQAGRRDRTNIEIVDARGEPILHETALTLIGGAVRELVRRGFKPTILARVLHRSMTVHWMIDSETNYGQSTDSCGKTTFKVGKAYNDAKAEPGSLLAAIRGLRDVHAVAFDMIPDRERTVSSSLQLAPGLVRSDERVELSERPAKVIATGASWEGDAGD